MSLECYFRHALQASHNGSVAEPRSMLNIAIFDPWQRSLFSRQRTPGKEPLLAGKDKPVVDKRLVLPVKFIHLSKTRVSNAMGSPRATLMRSPPGRDKIANAQPAGVKTQANAPQFPRGGG